MKYEEEPDGLYGNLKDYWEMVPTHHTPVYSVDKEIPDTTSVKVLTISKNHQNWKRIFDCPHLEELNLDQPSNEQVQAISELKHIKRLRIKSLRVKNLEFIKTMIHLEEVALEYVSGFSDLSPLQYLPVLQSLHLENLRKVSDFDGLRGIENLRYLLITGTLDWKQPIDSFPFLEELPDLEILTLVSIMNKTPFPAFNSVLKLKKIKELRIGIGTLDTAEYALLETALPHAKKGFEGELSWPLYSNKDHPDKGYVSLLGRGEGRIKLGSPTAVDKIKAYTEKYDEYIRKSREIIANY
ncbi:hypothetical protein C1637_21135 [Chryseobacterium lactis]|uniref:Leucine-rich repeat domain-containing protein n=1 Tax=Chryseobacterium lactis TaxID=1241981 RepID=A0A3G6RHY2_CHRLC|nr:hypothetical protein [Chryseobacterium lactis]AZA83424.1 leucine-rich repeat domain-containing protein [Chryseobacterium lactis]AZB03808.1 leucine-rich repeat domain-containing protein [Chryseobacterium lactis]PNW11615.1 hypothetical protein C1637_21135 [Chryseobacterium lactis]